ncbi:MAG: DNA gyrase subunit A, partial [Flavobacteriaceae bacterium]|nr:DNA gyrase subunit A [Flavobacteriaceae bacterium]
VTDKTGQLISIKSVKDGDDLMIINKSGIVIRLSVASLRVMGRATQGVKLINIKNSDSIAAVAKVQHEEESEEVENDVEIGDNSENGMEIENDSTDNQE